MPPRKRPRKRFDPLTLFERPRVPLLPVKYLSTEAELDAVASREKAISFAWWTRDTIETTEFLESVDQAFRRGLTVVLSPRKRGPPGLSHAEQFVHAYVLHHDQMWRVPAMTALEESRTYGGWSDALEAQASALLGYSETDISAWMKWRRFNQAGWPSSTIYTLLDEAQRERAEEYGFRTFGPPSSLEDMTFFAHAAGAALTPSAAKRVPRGLTLARVGLEHELTAELLAWREPRRKRHSIVSGTVTPSIARQFSRALRTPVQLLDPHGWSA